MDHATPDDVGRPLGFAHRGARAECRDNTLHSFARALELGARGLETDAWLTADGVVVLDHGGWLRRGARRHAFRTLQRCELPDHVPELEDLYSRWGRSFALSIDVKDPDAASPLLDVARRHGATRMLWLCSPDLDHLRIWRGLDPGVQLVHSTSLRTLTAASHDPKKAQASTTAALVTAHAHRLYAEDVAALNLHEQSWTDATIRAVQAEGVAAFAWDAQSAETLGRLVSLGADAVYSDHVALMLAVLRSV